jgi:hypothetical protein
MNVLHVLVVCALFGAATDDSQANRKLGEFLSTPRWSIAPEVSWFHYDEPGDMEEEGMLYGVAASYTRYYPAVFEDRILRLEGGFSAGQVDYDGALQDGTPYTMEGNDDYLVNARLLWGPLWHTATWANYFHYGLGYRYLQDDSSHDPAGYRRHSNYLYLPLGAKAYGPLGGNWYLELGGEFDVLIVGLQVSEIAESPTDSSSVRNWQWPGLGGRGSLQARYKTDSIDVAIAPFIQYWWLDDSSFSPSGTWYEPRNWSLQIGMDLVCRF